MLSICGIIVLLVVLKFIADWFIIGSPLAIWLIGNLHVHVELITTVIVVILSAAYIIYYIEDNGPQTGREDFALERAYLQFLKYEINLHTRNHESVYPKYLTDTFKLVDDKLTPKASLKDIRLYLKMIHKTVEEFIARRTSGNKTIKTFKEFV